jgi:hypothetical protein
MGVRGKGGATAQATGKRRKPATPNRPGGMGVRGKGGATAHATGQRRQPASPNRPEGMGVRGKGGATAHATGQRRQPASPNRPGGMGVRGKGGATAHATGKRWQPATPDRPGGWGSGGRGSDRPCHRQEAKTCHTRPPRGMGVRGKGGAPAHATGKRRKPATPDRPGGWGSGGRGSDRPTRRRAERSTGHAMRRNAVRLPLACACGVRIQREPSGRVLTTGRTCGPR